jgi:hypothetical protein
VEHVSITQHRGKAEHSVQNWPPCVELIIINEHVGAGHKEDELTAARQAALAARAAQGASQTGTGVAAASLPNSEVTAQPEKGAQGGAAPAQNGGLAEALERAQLLASEKVKERLRAEQEQESRGASHAAAAGVPVDAAKLPGASLGPIVIGLAPAPEMSFVLHTLHGSLFFLSVARTASHVAFLLMWHCVTSA